MSFKSIGQDECTDKVRDDDVSYEFYLFKNVEAIKESIGIVLFLFIPLMASYSELKSCLSLLEIIQNEAPCYAWENLKRSIVQYDICAAIKT
jgi:hypothetical protein